ncbi:MAG: ATP-binding protein [Propionibacteriaceae bacterium]|jgi:AAA+ ATPase superfamily predicted ATPase|nr:ATP-binding protein [Propionibacteriaceae bacterium]
MMLIGRREEADALLACLRSDKAHFVAVTGRRRVGKTFLVREVLGEHFTFYATGLAKATQRRQLEEFAEALRLYGLPKAETPKDWFAAFRTLRELIELSPQAKNVVFLDELPWMDTRRSEFVSALESFWNGWASGRSDVLLVVCGSATSWLVGNLFHNTGGLHNRVTRRINLEPFTLSECQEFLTANRVVMSTSDLLEAYMIFGGVPYYLDLLEPRFSLAQNVGRVCFAAGGQLRTEFDALYASLFQHSERHVQVVRAIAEKRKGLTRAELIKATKLPNGGQLTKTLRELEQSGFIAKVRPFNRKERGTLYQLVDFFTLFHLTFIENSAPDTDFWLKYSSGPAHSAWTGNSFELVCQAHLPQLLAQMGIGAVITTASSWRSAQSDPGAQIDLVIERADNVINLCEMKYSPDLFSIDKSLDKTMRYRRAAFIEETRTRKAVHLTLITPFGLKRNQYSDSIQSQVIMQNIIT